MKKILSLVLVCVLLVGCVLSFASCGMMFGTYENDLLNVTWEFSLHNATKTVELGEEEYQVVYTFKIKDDEIELTPKKYVTESENELVQEIIEEYNEKIEDAKEDGSMDDLVETYEFKKTDDGIEIGKIKYEKK